MTFRHSWYQSPATIYIDVFVKNTAPESVSVKLEGNVLCVRLLDDELCLNLSQSCSGVIYKIWPTKISLELAKTSSGEWKALEAQAEALATNAHIYPSSSKAPVQWDTIADNDEQSNDVQDFFKKIYEKADEDTRRAMLKSMSESRGTVLSTNWSEVGAKTVERRPPGSE